LGKPFDREISSIRDSITWAFGEPINNELQQIVSFLTQFPLLVVGSGGSYSGAHFVARVHEQISGKIGRAITPLEFLFSNINPAFHAVLFLTASGNNKDIISAFESAVRREFRVIGIICANIGSKIVKKCKDYPHVKIFEYPNPVGKDGFLAVNSLLSICILIARAYKAIDTSLNPIQHLITINPTFSNAEWNIIFNRNTIVAIGGEWAWPALIDLESKFTEAGLNSVLLSDLRNFAHGRHYWFDKKGNDSGLIVLETPPLAKLAKKTIDLLPKKYPRAVLKSSFTGPLASIELCIQIFHLINEAGKRACIDPGRPIVPEFGRKIYRIGLSPALMTKKVNNRVIWVQRKAKVSNHTVDVLEKFLNEFLERLKLARFSGIVFDYDGTLCDPPERFKHPKREIASSLNYLLSHGIAVGIATGRGRSVQIGMRKVIDEKYWQKILIGNYNGSTIIQLDRDLPSHEGTSSRILKQANNHLRKDPLLLRHAHVEIRSKQISITPKSGLIGQPILERISELLSQLKNVKITQSDHSIDILHPSVSKTSVVEILRRTLKDEKSNVLIIGDQGQYGGNDFELLNLPHSLSVDKISSSLTTCWNFSPIGLRGAKATISIINAIDVENKRFQLNIDRLEKEVVR